MKVSMDLLKKLREATFAPLKDCKDALVESNGDLDAAKDILKEKGILKAGKKANRETNEWLINVDKRDGKVVALKILCETDFVAKNETFLELIDVLMSKLFAEWNVTASLNDLDTSLLESLNNVIAEFVGKIGENVKLGDIVITEDNAFVYNHPGNRVASIVFFEGESDEAAKEVALQVAAMDPTYLSIDSVPQDYRDELKVKFEEEMKDSWKPENILEQIIKGKINKTLSEFVLLEQDSIRDGSKKVKEILPEGFKVVKYLRFAI